MASRSLTKRTSFRRKCIQKRFIRSTDRLWTQILDMNLQQDVDITDEIIDPDLFLRSFGISDDYCNVSDHKEILDIVQPAATSTGQGGDGVGMFQGFQQQGQKQSVIIKNDQMRGGGQSQVPVSD